MTESYLRELEKALRKTEIPDFSAGSSGYFSKPQKGLDPSIFAGEQIKPDVREHILSVLYRYWKRRGYNKPEEWTRVWVAGSGASYQWAADRGNGDLDILMGINWPKFWDDNPQWGSISAWNMTVILDEQLRQELWPKTAHTNFHGTVYEVTYFVNQQSTDILDINPYAAYDLTHETWTVPPNPVTAYDHNPADDRPAWDAYAEQDKHTAQTIRATLLHALNSASQYPVGHPYWVNAMNLVSSETHHALTLMTDIHGHRREAFGPNGKGYWDFNNWRWQTAKRNGVIKVLGAIERAHKAAFEAAQAQTYGAPLADADTLVTRAAMNHLDVR